jgi:ubiquinone/menaquinone biosynthesis C-methylase UbiE
MKKNRIPETDSGIQGEFNVAVYDQFQRNMRDRGLIETKEIIRSGIDTGSALEIGSGPGYVGLEWLKQTAGTRLTALEISPDMIVIAKKNVREYGLKGRWEAVESSGAKIPLDEGLFDAVFSCGSLHEWSEPVKTLNELIRVLKPGGKFFIGDLRRDIWLPIRWFMKMICKPKQIRPGLTTSINAAYTPNEIPALLANSVVRDYHVKSNPFGITLTGRKEIP